MWPSKPFTQYIGNASKILMPILKFFFDFHSLRNGFYGELIADVSNNQASQYDEVK
jgi:hypothetical protein